jgi:hypothetical protein
MQFVRCLVFYCLVTQVANPYIHPSFSQLVTYADRLGRGTPGEMLRQQRCTLIYMKCLIHLGCLSYVLRRFHFLFLQEEIDRKLAEILGLKTDADNMKPVKKKKEKPAKVEVDELICATQLFKFKMGFCFS